jgi:hypothetical protein
VGKERLFIRVTKRVDALLWKIFDNRGEELEEECCQKNVEWLGIKLNRNGEKHVPVECQ